MADHPTRCFHCGEPLAGRAPLWARIDQADVPMCCPGCRAAAQLIAELGLEDFYRFRTAPADRSAQAGADWGSYDDPALLETLTRAESAGRSVTLAIDGLTCAACGWLISRSLQQLPGVTHAELNTATGRARIAWRPEQLALSSVLRMIADLGYRPHIVTAQSCDGRIESERRAVLKRLAVAGLGMMQVMMFAVALYVGAAQGMEPQIRAYLRIVSLLVSTPVMLYAGWPYFASAARALARRSIVMDVPVSLALVLAFGASALNTWRHRGEVYFDSVTMFIFFLTVARYVEMAARHRSTRASDSLSRMLPLTAHRLSSGADGEEVMSEVPVAQLKTGDFLLVRSGEVVPADGALAAGESRFDESLLTGESLPLERAAGQMLTAGSINVGSPVRMRVAATGSATVLAGIVALLQRAQCGRPRIARAADRMASRFLIGVLIIAAAVCALWCALDPARAFPATLAVLVVACPCAFSLATLVAVASANAALARRGVLVTQPDAIESLAKVTRVVFDKTGTLTSGVLGVSSCNALGAMSARDCLSVAAALELSSEHPIARAFAHVPRAGLQAHELRAESGGVEGTVGTRRYRIGTRLFATGRPDAGQPGAPADTTIVLASDGEALASFTLEDAPRPELSAAMRALRRLGLSLEISSGDSATAVARVAAHCGIDCFAARQSPADKLERVGALRRAGEFVAMVGDGVNDAPVLGGAGVSIAMGRGSALTLATADLILVGDSLAALPQAFALARRAARVMRQNLAWAAAYNLVAMPLAAVGLVPPWAAAIGMSSSSVLVVLNALRLVRTARPRDAAGRAPAAAALTAPPRPAPALQEVHP
ncbi:MAG TPA: heavy metal translocating P-type ATPase [Steroidobacteraceae bacterium]|nr:heavy metal translocating P-type ATPase [Steroidobacteraceae bacterium]